MYDFTTVLDRTEYGSLIWTFTPEKLRKEGICSFRAAETDFITAPAITDAVARFAQKGCFGFTVKDGNYCNHVVWWMKHSRSWEIDPDWIVPVHGTIYAIATAIRLFLKQDDRIIVQPPFYDRYKQAADRLNRETVYNTMLREGDRYRIDFEGLEALMADPHNRLLILCNPNNPTGQVLSKEELTKIARLSAKYGVYVFSDEIFADIVLEGDTIVPYASIPEGREFAITSTSLGKAFSLTGMNHANLIIPDAKLREAYTKQRDADHYGSIEPSYYAATIGGYSPEGLDWVREMAKVVKTNSEIVHTAFETRMPRFSVCRNTAGFTCWIDFGALGLSGEALQNTLTERALYHIDPDTDYGPGMTGYARMSLGSTRAQTEAAMERMIRAFGK